jgi:hypothetical protein
MIPYYGESSTIKLDYKSFTLIWKRLGECMCVAMDVKHYNILVGKF